jgi:DNA-binding NarL/FixJ family response regulator
MIAIRDPEAHLQKQIEIASREFDFTPAEQSLAEALVRGRQLSDYALDRGVTMPTVRSQLRAVLSKSGTSRQVEFVAAVLSLPSF